MNFCDEIGFSENKTYERYFMNLKMIRLKSFYLFILAHSFCENKKKNVF